MDLSAEKEISIPVGVVVRRSPGTGRWAKWHWRAVAVLPGAAPAEWQLLREEGGFAEFHAATVPMLLHRKETEAYRTALAAEPPCVFVVLRPDEDPDSPHELGVHRVTASPYEAQDYLDSGEEIVERVPAPSGLVALIRDFVEAHHVDEAFRKRKRDRVKVEGVEDGKGDPRIRQTADVYRAPGATKPKTIH